MHFATLDLGTAHTTLLQVRLENGLMQYRGHVTVPSQGMKKGNVVAPAAAAAVMQAAARELERQTGEAIERVFLSLTGAQVKGIGSQAGISLTSRSREVTRDDARRVLDLARSISLPDDRQILHVIPQEFVLDRQSGILEPVGMLASRLEARIYAVTVAAGLKDNLVLAANHAGLEVHELIFAPLALAEASLSAEDRHTGAAVVDLGAGTTGIAIYSNGSLTHAAVIPVGGDHMTNDIAIKLSTSLPEAERIKCDFGAATLAYAGDNTSVEVPGPADRPPRLVPHRLLCECIEFRAQELIRLIKTELSRGGPLGAGVYISGGASRLQGFVDLLQASIGIPTRTLAPVLIEGMPDIFAEPEYAFSVGSCYYAHRLLARQPVEPTIWEKLRSKWAALGS
ncbi:MAG TPA: cell division protein FtsA [Terriglobales bacterium]|nr:cell division protein FtsA [Terriglobales bacterium]